MVRTWTCATPSSALDWPSYGRSRITAELRRQGWTVNPKRVQRLMREDNLLCVRKRKFVVATTDSDHSRRVYPNLAAQLRLTGINQLWVADITYIRLETEFVYLAVVIDAFSRRVIGCALDRTIEDYLTLGALRMAIEQRRPLPGWVHHSDRGSQYASNDYTELLKAHGCQISMSRKSSPWENAGCESWVKTLKYEEVYRQEYRDLTEARASIKRFIEKIYNQRRLHSALGYSPPAEDIAATLDRLAADPPPTLEELEQRLTALEDKLLATLRSRQTDEDLFEARRDLDASLRPTAAR